MEFEVIPIEDSTTDNSSFTWQKQDLDRDSYVKYTSYRICKAVQVIKLLFCVLTQKKSGKTSSKSNMKITHIWSKKVTTFQVLVPNQRGANANLFQMDQIGAFLWSFKDLWCWSRCFSTDINCSERSSGYYYTSGFWQNGMRNIANNRPVLEYKPRSVPSLISSLS